MWELIFVIIYGINVDAHLIDNAGIVSSSRIPVRTGTLENVYNTTYGQVQGFEDDGVLQFFDIPYGAFSEKSPFQEPVEPEHWHDIRQIKEHKSRCPQIDKDILVGDNECLTLNVFKSATKSEITTSVKASADVLFHIHDSSFSSGSGDPLIYGPQGLVDKDVILVLPNYRLGALGFLCLQNNVAPGNAALKDLTLALRWTMENIKAFGGNSSNIVVSGAGAGGALVEYLLISNMSRQYISRAITESGFSLSPWAIDRNPISTANSSYSLLQGDIVIEDLIRNTVNIDFKPCIEKGSGFITESPWQLLQKSQTQIDYMAGTANHAAWMKAVQQTETEYKLSLLNSNSSLLLPNDLLFENDDEKLRIGRRVRSLYFGERELTMTDINQISQLFSDSEYLNPGLRGARLFVKGGANVYFYEYSFNNPDLKQAFDASTRGDSLAFVFNRNEQSEEQTRMRDIMTSLWITFIKTGVPSAYNITWNKMKEVAATDEEWLSIGARGQMQKGLHLSRLNVWKEIYDKHFIDNNLGSMQKPLFYVYVLASGLSTLVQIGVLKP
ncbi:jg13120 [Pararge aegeria aegeria]|uniref:Jg13120 protein n=2 Tax=Pararge aegeria aegeria TaxID=348720 RepID=A0A8S4R937_9NEOP|nr:jg13120 [Pararge aegeria aegeria]